MKYSHAPNISEVNLLIKVTHTELRHPFPARGPAPSTLCNLRFAALLAKAIVKAPGPHAQPPWPRNGLELPTICEPHCRKGPANINRKAAVVTVILEWKCGLLIVVTTKIWEESSQNFAVAVGLPLLQNTSVFGCVREHFTDIVDIVYF